MGSRGVAEAWVAWAVAGAATVVLHLPLTPVIGLAIAVPWLAGAVVLAQAGLARRTLAAWAGALSGRAGLAGAGVLLLLATVTAVVVAPAAGALAALWVVAAGSVVAAWRGAVSLREQLAGWAMVGSTLMLGLLAGEAVLRIDRVATRIGTPAEIDAWWQRYEGLYNRNVLGIRSRYETLRKEPGVVRVVALGDSFTWGDKIASADSTWPGQLEAELRRRVADTPIEVVNLGEKGFTTVNEAEKLRRLGWQFDPDLVVVQFYLNDILPSGPDFVRGYSEWLFPRAWLLPARYRSGPAGRSALLHVTESVLTGFRHGGRAEQAETWLEVYRRRGPEWQALAAALEEMGRTASERGVPIVLLLFPDFVPDFDEGAGDAVRAIHDQVIPVAEAAGFTVVDLTDTFVAKGRDMRSWWATAYDAHPNAAASGVAARTLADHLVSHGLVGGMMDGEAAPAHRP